MEAINRLFTNLLTIGTGVGVTVAAFWLMWGAFLYMSAGGSPRQMETGKAAMGNALLGLAVVLTARVIAGLIQSALTGIGAGAGG
jgi:Type IV secretion system pilin